MSTKSPGHLYVLSPIYFDVKSYEILMQKIKQSFGENEFDYKVKFVVVDDSAGADLQIQKIKDLGVQVINPPFNLGHQRAIVYGLRYISDQISASDLVVTMDSDGEDSPEDVRRLFNVLSQHENCQVVLAYRSKRRETFIFKLFYQFFKLFFYTLTGTRVKSGNFAIIRGEFLKRVIKHPYFDLCYSSSLLALKYPLLELPCERGRRFEGKSKMNFNSLLLHGIRMLMPFMDKIAIRSFVIFSIAFGLGIISAFIIFLIKVATDLSIPGWSSSIITLTVIFSFIALGNFLVLFSSFIQNQGLAMKFLDKNVDP